jgi:hypothetical protein
LPETFYLTAICFILYLLLFCFLITKISFFKNAGLSKQLLLGLFLLKIIAGLVYAWFYSRLQLVQADTWRYFISSKGETDWLLRDPVGFIKNLFSYGYNKPGNIFSGENSYWNDLKSTAFIKMMAVFNVFTAKNYYADLVFFNFIFFFGPIAFFRLMMHYYPQKKWLLLSSVFMLPSFLFWCSGVHKDGIVFSAMAVSIYIFNLQLQQRKLNLKYILSIIFCFAVLFAFRNFLLFLLIPAMCVWFLASRMQERKWSIFIGIYAAGLILFFISAHIPFSPDMPQYVINKQGEFKALPGNSSVDIPLLEPTLKSFAHFFPAAIDMAFLRPHFSEAKSVSYIAATLENIFLILLIISCFFLRDKKMSFFSVNIFLLFYGLNVLFLMGYTVTFSGAIVRYKSVVLPLLVTFFIVMIDERRLLNIFMFKNSFRRIK